MAHPQTPAAQSAVTSQSNVNTQDQCPKKETRESEASAAAALSFQIASDTNLPHPHASAPDKSSFASASASAAAVLSRTGPGMNNSSLSSTSGSDGAKAAMLAHKAAMTSNVEPRSHNQDGQSAATQAFKANRNSQLNSRTSPLGRQGSLMAAKGVTKGAKPERPRSLPMASSKSAGTFSDDPNAVANNALKAATLAHRSRSLRTNRQLPSPGYASRVDADDQNHDEKLHASAVAMAKRMFKQNNVLTEPTRDAQVGEPVPLRWRRSSSDLSDNSQPMTFSTLQNAAFKLAQDRLANLHQDHLQSRSYMGYYRQGGVPQSRKFSVKGKLRKRSRSDGAVMEDMWHPGNSQREVSIFPRDQGEVDEKKRQRDRNAVLDIARKNVENQLRDIDDKITQKTGMIPPTRSVSHRETRSKARSHATAQFHGAAIRADRNKVDLDGGKFMTQEEIDEVAAKRVQPLIDEINDLAAKEQARQTEHRIDLEKRKEEQEMQHAREKEVKEIKKQLKEQDLQQMKERKAESKHEDKLIKQQEKAAHAEEKRQSKERNRSVSEAWIRPATSGEGNPKPQRPSTSSWKNNRLTKGTSRLIRVSVSLPEPSSRSQSRPRTHTQPLPSTEPDQKERTVKSSSISPTDKVKTWFKTRFTRQISRSGSKDFDEGQKRGSGVADGAADFGGVSRSGTENSSTDVTLSPENSSSTSLSAPIHSDLNAAVRTEHYQTPSQHLDQGTKGQAKVKSEEIVQNRPASGQGSLGNIGFRSEAAQEVAPVGLALDEDPVQMPIMIQGLSETGRRRSSRFFEMI